MKKGIISIILCCIALGLQAQNTPQADKMSNTFFYAEAGGPGVLFSANMDRRFNPDSPLGFGYRVGLGFGIEYEEGDDFITIFVLDTGITPKSSYGTIPVGINYLLGKENSPNMFEIGAGTTLLTKKVSLYNWDNDIAKPGNFIGHVTFMFRRQPLRGGFTFKAGLMTVIGTGGDLFPSAAAGFGYAF